MAHFTIQILQQVLHIYAAIKGNRKFNAAALKIFSFDIYACLNIKTSLAKIRVKVSQQVYKIF